jgi:hypothetical protein
MFTIRNMGGIALFLFGTTFLWLTPAFAGEGVSTTGIAWSIAQVLALVTLAGFSFASGVCSRRPDGGSSWRCFPPWSDAGR